MIVPTKKGPKKAFSESVHATKTATVIDFCSGLGGISLAATQLSLHVAAGVDLDKDALKTFERNFPNAHAIKGSVRSKTVIDQCRELFQIHENHSARIIVSGPPCQGFSAAGTRDPKDLRNKVLLGVARAIEKLQPDVALIENVSTVLSASHQDRISIFKRILAQANYHVSHLLLDASEFGVPQRRKRVFFFITREKVDEKRLIKLIESQKKTAINSKEALKGLPKAQTRPDNYNDEMPQNGVANHYAMQHSAEVIKKIALIKPGTGPMSYRRLSPLKPSNTLFSGNRAPPAHFEEPRSITVREAARLQGFPDSFRIYGSFANQMRQVTNAVPPPLALAALTALLKISGIQKEEG